MLGEIELKKLFPDFEDLVQPSGIDLELDEIFIQKSGGSLIDNEKNLPEIEALEGPIYTLLAKVYLAQVFCFCSDSSRGPWILWNIDVHDLQSWGI